ncbi:MAG TPA: IspD/TarI family cytidylyltransferase [Abditibacteriaceae bacterium]|nr:IspD/TarI family cytidylyltransferase [Abditibacteriaceae bacterium]
MPAAGCGARADLNGNKVLAPLCGRPLLWWTLRALAAPTSLPAEADLVEIVIAARADEQAAIQSIVDCLPLASSHPPVVRFVQGGASRQQSVANAVQVSCGDFLLVHDAARPLVSAASMTLVCQAALRDGAAILALPAADTVKSAVVTEAKVLIERTLDRSLIWLAQTPQVFRRAILLAALARAAADDFFGTDCASLVERIDYPVTIVPGEARNFKVTYAADLERAAALLGALDLETTLR